jgi:arylsulfatase A-like enzyme
MAGGGSLTPAFDALGRRSVVFRSALATSSWTRPSVGSLFTGRYPTAHGAQRMEDVLAEPQVTLAESLAERGYRCLGVITNGNVDAGFGFGQGFHRYLMPPAAQMVSYPGDFEVHDAGTVTAFTLDQVRRLRAEDPAAPLFVYVHYVDVHDPYLPHPGLLDDPEPPGRFDGSRRDLERLAAEGAGVTAADKERIRWLYRGEVKWTDLWVGRLLSGLADEFGSLDDALIVVTADHGEGLWDHGTRGHGEDLYDEQLLVPLLIHLPGMREGDGRTVETPVSLVDVAPTVLAAAGVPRPAAYQGVSLLRMIRGEPRPPEFAALYAELDFGDESLEAIRTASHKMVCTRRQPAPNAGCRLYDLTVDPGETVDLADRPASIGWRHALRRTLAAWSEALAASRQNSLVREEAALQPETRENLRALGYVGSDAGSGGGSR